MLVTNSVAVISPETAARSISPGVPSINRLTVSRTIRQAPKAMRTAMPSESRGSM